MAEPKMVEKELLADGIRLDGVDYRRGDLVTISEDHAKVLESHDSVGDKGTIEKREKAAADEVEREARRQRYLTGLQDPDEGREERSTAPSSSAPRSSEDAAAGTATAERSAARRK